MQKQTRFTREKPMLFQRLAPCLMAFSVAIVLSACDRQSERVERLQVIGKGVAAQLSGKAPPAKDPETDDEDS